MTIHPGTIAQRRSVLDTLPERAATAARNLASAAREASTFSDPALSDTGVAAEVQRRHESVRQSAAVTVSGQRAEASAARDYLVELVDRERPRITDHAHARNSWEQVKMYLDNGHTLHQVLTDADESMTLAIEEIGPHWLRAQRDPAAAWRTGEGPDEPLQQLGSSVLGRLAAVTRNPALSDAIAARLDAASAIETAAGWWEQMEGIAAGRTFDGLRAAAAVRRLQQRPTAAGAIAAARAS